METITIVILVLVVAFTTVSVYFYMCLFMKKGIKPYNPETTLIGCSNSTTCDANHLAFVINLEYNVDRIDYFMDCYRNAALKNVKLEKVTAVNGRQLSLPALKDLTTPNVYQGLQTIDATNIRESNDVLTRGMIGCYLSHIEIYKKLLNNSEHDKCIVFEDDAYFNTAINDALQKKFPDDWDLILLGTIRKFKVSKMDNCFEKVYSFWGTQGYLINKRGAQKLLQKAFPISQQIDGYMSELATLGELKVYAFIENLVGQRDFVSDVQMQVIL